MWGECVIWLTNLHFRLVCFLLGSMLTASLRFFRGEEYPILDTFYSVPNTICKSPLPFIASKKW